ncbi:cytochrome c oxidase subunit 4 [Dermabacteraceae bacterium TAE3-ERU27]|nr:cytochrome c oxidase subunit 4 [Dermabacteraceae bacterium TAE3-ERU27]
MRSTTRIFWFMTFFFLIVGSVYGLMSSFKEPMGFAAILMLSAMALMIAVYVGKEDKAFPNRPEDDAHGEVSDEAGYQGSFAPYSWWPLVGAVGASLCFTGLAAGWWIFIGGVLIGGLGTLGWVMEFSTGKHSH